MRKRRQFRLLLRLATYFGLGGVTAFFAFPWWGPSVLPAALSAAGIGVDGAERLDSGRIVLRGVVLEAGDVTFESVAVTFPAPHIYLLDRLHGPLSTASLVSVGPAKVRTTSAGPGDSAAPAREGPLASVRAAESALERYGPWLPPVEIESLEWHAGDGTRQVTLTSVNLDTVAMAGTASLGGFPGTLLWRAALPVGGPWLVKAASAAHRLDARVNLKHASDLLRLTLRIFHAGETLAGEAVFSGGSPVPASASLRSEHFSVPAGWIPFEIAPVTGDVKLEALELSWNGNLYEGTTRIEVGLSGADAEAIPLLAELAFGGDERALRIRELRASTDWADATLLGPVGISLEDGRPDGEAALEFRANLSEQALIDAEGTLAGTIRAEPSERGRYHLSFALEGSALRYRQHRASGLSTTGELRGTHLVVDGFRLTLDGPEGGAIGFRGDADLARRTLDLDYDLSAPAGWVNEKLGSSLLSGPLTAAGTATGTFDRPEIRGTAQPLPLRTDATKTITVEGEFTTAGFDQIHLSGTARCEGAVIETTASFSMADGAADLHVERLHWSDPDRPPLDLAAPVRIHLSPDGGKTLEERVTVTPFHFYGENLEIRGRFDAGRGLEFGMRNISLARIDRWLQGDLPAYHVAGMELAVAEFRPFLIGRVDLHFEESLTAGERLRLDLAGRLDPDALAIDPITIRFAGTPLLEGAIRIPVRFRLPGQPGERPWELLEKGELAGTVDGHTNEAVADWLADRFGVRIGEGTARLDLHGSLREPLGQLAIRFAGLARTDESPLPAFPSIDFVAADARIDPETASLDRFEVRVNESTLAGSSATPTSVLMDYLGAGGGDHGRLLARSTARLDLSGWEAKNWSDWLPAFMRRTGILAGTLDLRPGPEMSGALRFRDFAVRPTRSLPLIDRIAGRLSLEGNVLRIENAAASVGGDPVTASGRIDLRNRADPRWEIHLEGANVPLVRTSDMILRSDLDLVASNLDRTKSPVLRGRMDLRASTLLLEFDPLAPNLESQPANRPPFFSITQEPFADWRFEVVIAGDSFMRVRSPYLRTKLSANFDLGGTFAFPVLTGSLRNVGGDLQFPGARVRLDDGRAFITPGRSDEVQLDLSGIAQTPAHVIAMEVTGTLANPQVHLQSTPDLPNSSTVKLLATGTTTSGGIGTAGLNLGKGILGAGAGEDSFVDKITIDVGLGATRSGGNTVGVRYDLSEVWLLEGEYDIYDAYNLDLIRILFRR